MWNYLSFILLFKLGINVVDKKNDRMILISVSSFLESLRFFSKYVYLRFLDLEKYIIWIRTLGSNVKKAWLIEYNLEKILWKIQWNSYPIFIWQNLLNFGSSIHVFNFLHNLLFHINFIMRASLMYENNSWGTQL